MALSLRFLLPPIAKFTSSKLSSLVSITSFDGWLRFIKIINRSKAKLGKNVLCLQLATRLEVWPDIILSGVLIGWTAIERFVKKRPRLIAHFVKSFHVSLADIKGYRAFCEQIFLQAAATSELSVSRDITRFFYFWRIARFVMQPFKYKICVIKPSATALTNIMFFLPFDIKIE